LKITIGQVIKNGKKQEQQGTSKRDPGEGECNPWKCRVASPGKPKLVVHEVIPKETDWQERSADECRRETCLGPNRFALSVFLHLREIISIRDWRQKNAQDAATSNACVSGTQEVPINGNPPIPAPQPRCSSKMIGNATKHR
jgi:hypothetical protein